MGPRRSGRVAAFQALYAWEESRVDVQDLLRFDWLETPLNDAARAFASLMVRGALESMDEIDLAIRRNLKKWSFERLNKVDLAILRLGCYALLYQKDIPANVSIDEAVEISKSYGAPESFRFVNGVLDGISKAALS